MTWTALSTAPIIGVLVEFFSEVLGILAVSTGLSAAALRALAILRKSSTEQVEWMTAVGTLAGVAFGALVLALDLVFG